MLPDFNNSVSSEYLLHVIIVNNKSFSTWNNIMKNNY